MIGSRVRATSRSIVMTAVFAVTLIGVGQHGAFAATTVSGVTGSAYGFFTHVSFFGGPFGNQGPKPKVALPPGGSASPVTASDPSETAAYGPAVIFTSGPATVSTQGTTGATGTVTSSSQLQTIFGGPFTADSGSSTCTASATGVTGSTTFANGQLVTKTDANGNPVTTVAIPDDPPPNDSISGTIDSVGDSFTYVFNEQIVKADGSLTVNAGHEYLLGPNARGDLIFGQSVCGVKVSTAKGADLSVRIVDKPDPVAPLGTVIYTVTVTNNGPATANDVVLLSQLTGVRVVSAAAAGGSCVALDPSVICSLGHIPAGARKKVTITATARSTAGTASIASTVYSASNDPNLANNSAVATTTIS